MVIKTMECVLFVTLALFCQGRDAAAYGAYSDLTYSSLSDQLSGYATTWKEWFDDDWGEYCSHWEYDEEYEEWYCAEDFYWEFYASVYAYVYAPSGGIAVGGYARGCCWWSRDATWYLNPSTPYANGTWTITGDHYEERDDYYWDGWFWWPLGTSYNYVKHTSSQVNVLPCGDERGDIIREYVTYNVDLRPACEYFTQTRRSTWFDYGEIAVTDEYSWALVKDALIASQASGYGLDAWRADIGYGSRIINSGYRNPHRNGSTPGAANNSRHMYGDAADLKNQSGTDDEYWTMYNAAWAAAADFVEPPSGPCAMVCTHADWRSHGGSYQ